MKALLFVCQELSRDIECQIKGVVLIGFPLDRIARRPSVSPSVISIMKRINQFMVPVRVVAFHLCIPDDPWFRLAAALLLQTAPRIFRLRSRVHVGKFGGRLALPTVGRLSVAA